MEGQQANKFLWNIHTAIEKSRVPGSDEDKRFLALALYGEAGEVANLIKKKWRGDQLGPDHKSLLRNELGDVYAYLKLLAMAYEVGQPEDIWVNQLASHHDRDEVLHYSALSLCATIGRVADALLIDWAAGHAKYSAHLGDLILDSFYELFNLADKCSEDLNEILETEIIPKVRKRWGHLIEG